MAIEVTSEMNNFVLPCMALYLIGVVSPSEPHMYE